MGATTENGSMKKFKEDYPEVYQKFLEMNRALARLLLDRGTETQAPIEQSSLPTELEWD